MWNFIKNRMTLFPESKIYTSDCEYTYMEIICASELHGLTLKKMVPSGSKCAILCKNEIYTALSVLAAWYAGLIVVPLSVNYGTRHCQSIFTLVHPDIVITDCLESETRLSSTPTYNIISGEISNSFNLTGTTDSSLTDVAAILCTSGTTGVPKGAVISKRALKGNVLAINDYFEICALDNIAIVRPLYHCAVLSGEFLVSLINGVNIGFCHYKYSTTEIIDFCIKKETTVLCGTPTLLRHISLLARFKKDRLTVKTLAISGECLKKEVAAMIRAVFSDSAIYSIYGLTEASPRVSYLPPCMFDNYPESVGYPLVGVQIKIMKDGEEVGENIPGMIMVNSPYVMNGYYNDPKVSRERVDGKWLITGDIGYKDCRGLLYVLSRADDMIIKGGMNIYPAEIEQHLEALPEVMECIAYGVVLKWGTGIAVDVVLSNEFLGISKKELFTLFSTVLPDYQMPTQINVVEKLKKNASGKKVRNENHEDSLL